MADNDKFAEALDRAAQRAGELASELDDMDSDDPFEDTIRNGIEEWERMSVDLLKKVREHYGI